jgi:sortase A
MNKANLFKRVKFIRMLAVFTLFLGIGAITIAMIKIQTEIAQYSTYSNQYVLEQTLTIQKLQETAKELINNAGVIEPVNPIEKPIEKPVIPVAPTVVFPLDPEPGEHFGDMTIPVLSIKVPLIEGTHFDALEKGVGHYIDSVMPGVVDNCVLAGHRDTVFKQLGELQLEDQLIVTTAAGTYTYIISDIRIVDADDLTVIVPSKTAILTLSTCYPFNTPGYYPQRYIVSADLIVAP